MNIIGLVFFVIFFIFGAVIFYLGYTRARSYRLINMTPRSNIGSMPIGLVEVHGNVKARDTIKTPFSHADCVYYKYDIEEYKMDVAIDSEGEREIEYTWDTIDSHEQSIPFFAEDETGNVYVNTRKAEFMVTKKKVYYQKAGLLKSLPNIITLISDWKNSRSEIMNATELGFTLVDSERTFGPRVGDRRIIEYYLEPDENLFVIGTAGHSRYVPGNTVIRKGIKEPIFIISNRSEKQLVKVIKKDIMALFLVGAMISFFALIFLIIALDIV